MALSTFPDGYRGLREDLSEYFHKQISPEIDPNRARCAGRVADRNTHMLIRLDSILENYRLHHGHPLIAASDLDYLLRILQIEYKLSITNINQITFDNMLLILADRFSEDLYHANHLCEFIDRDLSVNDKAQELRSTIAQLSRGKRLLPPLDWQNLPYDILHWKLIR